MKQFNLDTWLKDKSHKVVTRDGKEVTIEKTDIHIHGMSHMILGKYSDSNIYEIWHSNGRINYTGSDCNLDLFFADEGDGLTELQKTLEEDCDYYVNLYNDGTTREELREWIKCWCNRIIDLARNELEKSNLYSGNQKQEWSEEDEKNWRHCLHYIDAYVTPVKEHVDWFKNIRNRIHSQQQPKQEWSEEDEKLLNSAISLVYEVGDISLHSWLKSIKDRVQPQPKQDWNEKDREMLDNCLGLIQEIDSTQEEQKWLKSIKPGRYRWKPSEEQLTDLYYAAKQLSVTRPNLQILYNDIKQL